MVAYTRFMAAALAVAGGASADNTKYSQWMAQSLMARGQGIMNASLGASGPLQCGFTQKAFTRLAEQYSTDSKTPAIKQYVLDSAAAVAPFLSDADHDAHAYPLDRLSNGNALYVQKCHNDTFLPVARALRDSIDLNPRNAVGGLWYFTYPYWSYLDGMFSLIPFWSTWILAHPSSNSTAELADMHNQIQLLWDRCQYSTTGLLVHGYDDSKTAVWANPTTGASPHVWDRSLGWFLMTLVDTLEILPQNQWGTLLSKFRTLSTAVMAAVDPATGGWWQVMDMPGQAGNYIESSGSAMFAYSLLKGARLGYLTDNKVEAIAMGVRAHNYITNTFVVHESDGTLGYNGTVAVCSLNSNASYAYYVGQPLLYNSVLGSAAYILASLEVERYQL